MSAGTVALLKVLADCTARQVRLSVRLANPETSAARKVATRALLTAVNLLNEETVALLNAGQHPSMEWMQRINRVNTLILTGAHLDD